MIFTQITFLRKKCPFWHESNRRVDNSDVISAWKKIDGYIPLKIVIYQIFWQFEKIYCKAALKIAKSTNEVVKVFVRELRWGSAGQSISQLVRCSNKVVWRRRTVTQKCSKCNASWSPSVLTLEVVLSHLTKNNLMYFKNHWILSRNRESLSQNKP